ncbi:hypothetical protein B5F40_03030 [Gordonibacter sp. An230]|uniref:hypothetical protein n=1 Tax=Gordonibacter sp. An230 TaxID=1965592 RepID=UPI000B36D36A|nr:hypothetical protein [Gordonibacter sp. An230]OUO91431.1 hypothetical protein B5F40_03030 [Gordonibacter sp. An230]
MSDARDIGRHDDGPPPLRAGRALVVVARWLLAAACAAAIPLAFDALALPARLGAFAALSFLLANALWQHLPLTPACLAAFAASALFAVVVVALVDAGGASDAGNLIFYLCFAALGAALARLALKTIDRTARRRL